jgi:uncharacterized protein YjbI with pentapeptide repeats
MRELKQEVFGELLQGNSARLRELPMRDGRYDLSGVMVAEPTVERTFEVAGRAFQKRSGISKVQGQKWENIDFTDAELGSMQFHDCELANCVFKGSNCSGWKAWRSNFRNCRFERTDLREAALGPVANNRRNYFAGVEFVEADMRNSYWTSAELVNCVFRNAKLVKMEFGGSVFTDCAFIGKLDEVLFYDLAFDEKNLTPNEMVRMDFRQAQFRFVEFRRLNLETVLFPAGDDYIRFEDRFRQAVEKVIAAVGGREDLGSRKIGSVFKNKLKWLGVHQRRGVMSKLDIREMAGEDGVRLVEEAVREFL